MIEFNALNVELRTKELRKEFGSSRKLAEAAGCPVSAVIHYCSPAYLKEHLPSKERWEKYFGKWDQDTNHIPKKEEISEEKPEAVVVMNEEQPKQPEAKKQQTKSARIIIEVPSLEELEETLTKFGFRLEFEKK